MRTSLRLLLIGCALAASACSASEAKPDPVKPAVEPAQDKQADALKRVLKKAPYANPRWEKPPVGMQDGTQKD